MRLLLRACYVSDYAAQRHWLQPYSKALDHVYGKPSSYPADGAEPILNPGK
jgi:hypothetical protein